MSSSSSSSSSDVESVIDAADRDPRRRKPDSPATSSDSEDEEDKRVQEAYRLLLEKRKKVNRLKLDVGGIEFPDSFLHTKFFSRP